MFAVARRHRNVLDARVTPIVFLPGIMGSRLRFRETDSDGAVTTVDWDPDSSVGMGRQWLLASTADKVRRLDPSTPCEVLATGNGLNGDQCGRGWAGVVAKFYLDMLEELESGLHSSMFRCPVRLVAA